MAAGTAQAERGKGGVSHARSFSRWRREVQSHALETDNCKISAAIFPG